MACPHYERLSALDAAMVFMETSHTHMHIGEVGILEAGPGMRSRICTISSPVSPRSSPNSRRSLSANIHETPRGL